MIRPIPEYIPLDPVASKPLTVKEEAIIIRRVQRGDRKALSILLQSNDRYILQQANKYPHSKMPLEDLRQEGRRGLLEAAKRFDVTLGFRFLTYATWWIHQAIRIEIREHDALVKTQSSLFINRGNRPKPEHEAFVQSCLSPVRIDALEEELGGEFLASDTTTDAGLEDKDRDRFLAQALEELEPKWAQVLRLRFGFRECKPLKLQEIGDQIGLTREGVRLIEKKAMAALKKKLQGKVRDL